MRGRLPHCRWSVAVRGVQEKQAAEKVQVKGARFMTPKPRERPVPVGPVLVARTEPAIEWQDYARIEAGIYPAVCNWAKHYRDPMFKRWTCLLRFDVRSVDLLSVIACVPFWMNLGGRERPHAGRRTRYFAEWVRANGGPPARRDRLSPRVFTARIARVKIGDTNSAAPYSVVREIVSWETGCATGHSVNKSHSQGRHP